MPSSLNNVGIPPSVDGFLVLSLLPIGGGGKRAVWEVDFPSVLGMVHTLELGVKDSCIHVTRNRLLGTYPIRTVR